MDRQDVTHFKLSIQRGFWQRMKRKDDQGDGQWKKQFGASSCRAFQPGSMSPIAARLELIIAHISNNQMQVNIQILMGGIRKQIADRKNRRWIVWNGAPDVSWKCSQILTLLGLSV